MSLWDDSFIIKPKTRWYEWFYFIPIYFIGFCLSIIIAPLGWFILWIIGEE